MIGKELWTALDENYFYPAIISLTSATRKLDNDLVINIACDVTITSERSMKKFKEVLQTFHIKANFHPIDMPETLPVLGHITSITFARLRLLEILEHSFVWIDVDTFFPNGISELLDYAKKLPEGFKFSAFPSAISTESFTGVSNAAVTAAGDRYFNAGVFVAEPATWRNAGFGNTWIELLTRYQELGFIYLDQCIMNYLVSGEYIDLPRRFNSILTRGERLIEAPVVLHFAGPTKPWLLQILQLPRFFGTSAQAKYFRKYFFAEVALFFDALLNRKYRILWLLLKYKIDANFSFAHKFFGRKFNALIKLLQLLNRLSGSETDSKPRPSGIN